MKLAYPACFYKDEDSDVYAVEVPDLPGCASGGNSLVEALAMGIDAASGWILTYMEEGRLIPVPSPIGNIKLEDEGFVSLIYLDIDEYAKRYGKKAVRKNITIPAYLNAFAESQHINFSQLVHDALAEKSRQLQQ